MLATAHKQTSESEHASRRARDQEVDSASPSQESTSGQFQGATGNHGVQRYLQAKHDDATAGSEPARSRVGKGAIGNQGLPRYLQAKLTVNTPGDEYEQEADSVAHQVMRMPEQQVQRKCDCGGSCNDCQKNEPTPKLRMKSLDGVGSGMAEAPPSVHETLSSPGQPLDKDARAFMEPRFGRDFSHVRVHSGGVATESARTIGASAYTVGNDIVFADGQGPGKKELLAHELSHVVQQQSAGTSTQATSLQRAPGDKPVAWPRNEDSHYGPAPANVHHRKDTGPTAGPHASGIPDPGMPKPATVQDKLIDAAMDEMRKKVASALKSEVSVDRQQPDLSPEQEALVDFASGVNQYKQYLTYAKTALELLQLSPGSSVLKQRLVQVFGNLDQLGNHLNQISGVLGTVSKYTVIVKDAVGITKSAGKLVKSFSSLNLDDMKSVRDFANAFSEFNAEGQSLLQSARDSLIAQGLKGVTEAAKGGLVLGALSFYMDMADEGLQAGLKNVNAYIASRKKILDQIENGGVTSPQPDIPTLLPPPDVQTVAGQRMQTKMDQIGRVLRAVSNAFDDAKAKVKADIDRKKQKVRVQFDRDIFPRVYRGLRPRIKAVLASNLEDIKNGGPQRRGGTEAEHAPERQADLTGALEWMREHDRSGPSLEDLRDEMNAMPSILLSAHVVKGNYVIDVDPANNFKGTLLETPYDEALAKTNKEKGVDDAALQNAYTNAGLTLQNERAMQKQLFNELGLSPSNEARPQSAGANPGLTTEMKQQMFEALYEELGFTP